LEFDCGDDAVCPQKSVFITNLTML
jgi:hypothetical protein